jgi:hypothetical protein
MIVCENMLLSSQYICFFVSDGQFNYVNVYFTHAVTNAGSDSFLGENVLLFEQGWLSRYSEGLWVGWRGFDSPQSPDRL